FDARLELLDSSGAVLSTATSDAGIGRTGTDETISFTASAAMTYLLRVTTENPGGTGAYTAAVWSADDYASLVSVTRGAVAVDGSLSSADAYNPFFLPGESLRHDQYRLDLSGVTAGVPVEVTMSSTLSRTAL